MPSTHKHKDIAWTLPDAMSWDLVPVAVLMDLRDQAQETNRLLREIVAKLGCYRIPRALDAAIELGADARRRKRLAAKRRKAKKASA